MAVNKYDIYLEILPEEDVQGIKVISFGEQPTKFMIGFYKTILHFVKCLLTEVGSDIGDSTYGTALGGMIGGNAGDVASLRDIAILSVSQATDKIKEYQSLLLDKPKVEILSSVEVTSFDQIGADEFNMNLRLRNAAGELMIVRLPLDITTIRG